MDESGDLGFGVGSKYFVLAFIDTAAGKALNKAVKNFNAHLINNGWNRDIEIKATNLWHSPKNELLTAKYRYKKDSTVPIETVLRAIAQTTCRIGFVVIKLENVYDRLKEVDCSILYNYFSWILLQYPLCSPEHDVSLYVDRRNREQHNLLKFDGYVEAKVGIERAERNHPPLTLQIQHLHANSATEFSGEQRARIEFGIRGLQAADFVCWAIKRQFEDNELRWIKLLNDKISLRKHLYFEEKKKSS
jgi:uncharacterized protein DUF3800